MRARLRRLHRLGKQITGVIFLFSAFCLLLSGSAYAGLAVSVTGGDWAIGTIGMGVTSETTTDKWTITGSTDTLEAVYIKADGVNWSPAAAADENAFILKYDAWGSWSDAITNTGSGIALAYIGIAGTKAFDLQFTAPTSTTVGGEHSLTVTLTAVTWDLTVTDADANTYNTVAIGSQLWMAENLNVGTKVTGVTEQTDNATIEKYCYDDLDANCTTDGGLYQWDEMMQYVTTEGVQGICPTGWHIPTDAEQHTLDDLYDGGTCDPARVGWGCDPAGTHLSTLTLNGDNSSGFTALLAGYRDTGGSFVTRGAHAYFRSSSESGTDAWWRHLLSDYSTVYRVAYGKASGFSVRCLKD